MEEVETDNAVILKCCHEPEDSRKGRRNLQHMAREKKLDENNQPTDADDITIILLVFQRKI